MVGHFKPLSKWLGPMGLFTYCKTKIETQEHMLRCHELQKHLNHTQMKLLNEVHYSDLFESTDKQLSVTKVFKILLGIRDRVLGNPRSRPATAKMVDPVASTCLS